MKRCAIAIVCGVVAGASGCSTTGPGLAHHPLDCAMGVRWADCQPGTPGYNNGGGQQTRAQELVEHRVATRSREEALASQCKASYETPTLDVIRNKVELYRSSREAAPPFEIAANNTFPAGTELPAIGTWAKLREECVRREDTDMESSSATASDPVAAVTLEIVKSMRREAVGRVSELTVALYQQKMTYGEFAQKRYEISRDESAAEKQLNQSAVMADEQRRTQARELAQKDFHDRLTAWSAYTQSVTARPPQTVVIQQNPQHCTSYMAGSSLETNCN
jgi:hypothetical protein